MDQTWNLFHSLDFCLKKQWARTFLILWEYQTQAVGVSGYFGKIKPLPPTWSKPFSFIWSVRFYELLENFFKCSSPEEIFDYMRKKEIERDDLMLCNGDDDDDDDDDGGGGGDVANDVILNNAVWKAQGVS